MIGLLKNYTRRKGEILNRCKRCDNLMVTAKRLGLKIKIWGEHQLLREKPQAIKKCGCCKHESTTYLEMTENFRRFRNNTKPSSFVEICKKCENTATMILSEFKFLIREGLSLKRGSKDYLRLLESIYLISGHHETPRDLSGAPKDLLKYHLNFCKLDGQPLTSSAVSIRQIKINVGYMPRSETVCKK